MGLPIEIEPAASFDIEDLTVEMYLHSPAQARKFLAALRKTYDFLADFPGAGPSYMLEDPNIPALRKWAVDGFKNYLIFYRDDGVAICIVRVIHGSRDIPNLLKKL